MEKFAIYPAQMHRIVNHQRDEVNQGTKGIKKKISIFIINEWNLIINNIDVFMDDPRIKKNK